MPIAQRAYEATAPQFERERFKTPTTTCCPARLTHGTPRPCEGFMCDEYDRGRRRETEAAGRVLGLRGSRSASRNAEAKFARLMAEMSG